MSKPNRSEDSTNQSALTSAELIRTLLDQSSSGIIITDSEGKCLQANRSACNMLGYSREELTAMSFGDLFAPTTADAHAPNSSDIQFADQTVDETSAARKDGTRVPVDLSVRAFNNGVYISVFREIGNLQKIELESDLLNRVCAALGQISRAILRAADSKSLFINICDVAVHCGEFTLAAVGLLEDDRETLHLETWRREGSQNRPYDRRVVSQVSTDGTLLGRAIMTGRVVTSVDLQSDPEMAYWHTGAAGEDLHSAAVIPFRTEGKIAGVFSLVASEAGLFNGRAVTLLAEMGSDLSFVLDRMRIEEERSLARSALHVSEERYRSIFDSATIGLYRITPDGRILMANPALIRMLGYRSLEDLQDGDLQTWGFAPDHFRREFDSRMESDRKVIDIEDVWRRADGGAIYVRVSATAVHDAEGMMLYYEGAVEDITDRKAAEEIIREKNDLLDEMSRMAKIGAWEFKTDSMKGTWTDEVARIHGLDPSVETNAEYGMSFYHGKWREQIESAVREAIEIGKPYDLELEMVAADGTHKWVRTIAHCMKENGKVVRVRGTFQDVTEFKQAKDRIRYLTRLYATLSQVNQTIMRMRNLDELFRAICDIALQFGEFPLVAVGLYDKVNQTVKLAAWKGEVIEDQPYSSVDIGLPQYKDGLLSAAIRNNRVVTSDNVPAILETKHWRQILVKHGLNVAAAVPFRLKGEVVGVLTLYAVEPDIFMPEVIKLLEEIGLDISFALDAMEIDQERRQNEEALERERDRLAKIAATTPGLICSYRLRPDGSACMPYASPAIRDIYGLSPEDVVDDLSPVFANFHPDDIEHVNRKIQESARTMTPWHDEFRYIHPAKGEVWIEGHSVPLKESDGSITWHGFIQDVTERKRAEEALRASEEKLQSIMDQMTEAVFVSDSEGILTFVSSSCERVFGFKAEDMVGKSLADFLVDADSDYAAEEFAKFFATGEPPTSLELSMKRKDGSSFFGELDVTSYRSSQLSGSIGLVRDVTARKKAEEDLKEFEAKRIELERQLMQAQRLESLGILAGGIAHDFNNILGVIIGYSNLLKESGVDPAKAQRIVDSIERASERGAALVRQLLMFARKTETVSEPVSVNDIIREAVKFLSETFPKTINMTTDLMEGIPSVIGDATQLHQVCMNLCINARDAMPRGGDLAIKTFLAEEDDIVSRFPGALIREYIVMSVADTGTGMDENTKRRVFDPFFTTKEPGKGTGLGLAVVYSIVRSHEGFVGVESEPGSGTTFNVYLPAAPDDRAQSSDIKESSNHDSGGSETVLVIEDEEMLLEILEVVLVSRGYKVVAARDGEEGVDVYSRRKDEIAVVITDLGLPKLSGDQVFHRIKKLRPDAEIVIASGFVDPDIKAELIGAGARHFLQKPYKPPEILEMIHSIVNGEV